MTQTNERNQRRTLRGTVTSDKMDKTITVTVDQRMKHPKYGKYVRHTRRYHAHDEQNEAGVGDVVEIAETRRLSRQKSWRLARIVERAEIV